MANSGWNDKNTTVRIESHRLSIISLNGMEISEDVITDTVIPIGPTNASYNDHKIGVDSPPAFIWLTGSAPNQDVDLAHMANRVIDLLKHTGPHRVDDVIARLAARDQHEAIGLLLEMMIHVDLLEQDDDQNFRPNLDEGLLEYKTAFRKLRCIYDHPRAYFPKFTEDKLKLFDSFKNLHPFSIAYTAKWEHTYPPATTARIVLQVLVVLMSVLALVLAIIGFH